MFPLLALSTTPLPADHTVQVAFITAGSAFLVAIVGGISSYIVSHRARDSHGRTPKLVAYERFLLRLGFDPRRIHNGYEDEDRVRISE